MKEPLPLTLATSLLAADFVKSWMNARVIQDPGERWQALPPFDDLVAGIIKDPESFLEAWRGLR